MRKSSTISVMQSTNQAFNEERGRTKRLRPLKRLTSSPAYARQLLDKTRTGSRNFTDTVKCHHDAIYVVDMEGARKKNLKFYHRSMAAFSVCFYKTSNEYIQKVNQIRDSAFTEPNNRGSVAHIPSNRTPVTTWWSQTMRTSCAKVNDKDTLLEETPCTT